MTLLQKIVQVRDMNKFQRDLVQVRDMNKFKRDLENSLEGRSMCLAYRKLSIIVYLNE